MRPKLMKQALFKTAISTYVPATWNGVNTSKWTPLGIKVLIAPDMAAETTAGGIQLPQDVIERNTLASESGIVIELGPDCQIKIKPGDRVYMEKYAGQLITGYDERVYRLMDESCIGAVIR